MSRNAILAAVLVLGAPGLASAEPDVVIIAAPGTTVTAEEVEAALRQARPNLTVSTGDAVADPGGARVTLQAWPDGRIAVEYRDADGRETVRVVETGPSPAATIAMVVVNLQENQLDTVLGPGPGPAAPPVVVATPPSRAAAATPRLRTTAPTSRGSSAPVAAIGLGLGLANRSLEIAVTGSPKPRTFSAPGYPTFVAAATFFPGRWLTDDGVAAALGVAGRFERNVYLAVSGVDATTMATVDIPAAHQEEEVSLLVDLPVTDEPHGPRVRASIGYSSVAFELDPAAMARLDEAQQIPSFEYEGVLFAAGGELPVSERVRLGLDVQVHDVLDVGQAVRDLFGADTEGGWGIGAQASMTAEIMPHLVGDVSFRFRQYRTDLRGPSSFAGGAVDAFTEGTDRTLDLVAGLSYRAD